LASNISLYELEEQRETNNAQASSSLSERIKV